MNTISVLDQESNEGLFERVTEEEVIYLWRSIKGRCISESEAWNAVVIGLALDVAFGMNKANMQVQH